MKKINISSFMSLLKKEIKEYEFYQSSYSNEMLKTPDEWVESFLVFAGYQEEKEFSEQHDGDYIQELYGDYEDFAYDELVNRRKYRSFRDDDRY